MTLVYKFDDTPGVLINTSWGEDIPGADIEYVSSGTYPGRALWLTGSWREKTMICTHEIDDAKLYDLLDKDGNVTWSFLGDEMYSLPWLFTHNCVAIRERPKSKGEADV